MALPHGRRLKKLRRRQREAVEQLADAIIDAEEKRDAEDNAPPLITQEAMDRVEREGLCREESLEVFMSWFTFGGLERGLSLTEILEMPLWLRKDFRYILSRISTRRRERKYLALASDEEQVKPKKGRSRHAR